MYKLLFGPKSFIVISDPTIAKHILRDNAKAYDKGLLAEILEPIMGKGLIPADPETWKVRRRAIVPGFHKAWYNEMIKTFASCNRPLLAKLSEASSNSAIINMETEFCSVSLDIIGKAVFNYEFGSVTQESPVIQAVYCALKEVMFSCKPEFYQIKCILQKLSRTLMHKFKQYRLHSITHSHAGRTSLNYTIALLEPSLGQSVGT